MNLLGLPALLPSHVSQKFGASARDSLALAILHRPIVFESVAERIPT